MGAISARHRPRDTGQIGFGGRSSVNPAAVIKPSIIARSGRVRLPRQGRRRGQQPCGLRNERAIGVKPVVAAVERAMRIVFADLGGETGDIGRADIGRVGDDQVETARQCRGIVAGDECGAVRQARGRALLCAVCSAAVADVGADAIGFRQFGQQRQQNCARARADIGNAQRRSRREARSISSATSTSISVSGRGTSVAVDS